MKENIIKSITFAIIIIIILISVVTVDNNKVTNDEKKFKEEYESLNGKTNQVTNKKYPTVEIDIQNNVKYIDSRQAIKILEKKTGIIYFGFAECPWCRNMIEPFLEAIEEENIEKFYYCDALSIRDEKKLNENGEVETVKEGDKNYYKILQLLGDKADKYEGLNDDSIKRLYFPTVVFVKDGEIVDTHTSTIDSQENPYKKLTKKEQKKLKNIYKEKIEKMNSNVCTGKESC